MSNWVNWPEFDGNIKRVRVGIAKTIANAKTVGDQISSVEKSCASPGQAAYQKSRKLYEVSRGTDPVVQKLKQTTKTIQRQRRSVDWECWAQKPLYYRLKIPKDVKAAIRNALARVIKSIRDAFSPFASGLGKVLNRFRRGGDKDRR